MRPYADPVPTLQDDAICIRHWDWSETSQTVSLLTRAHGMVRGLAKGSKREKGRFCGGIELLTRGQLLFISKPSSDLATLTEWDLTELFPGLRQDLRRFYAGMYLADLLQHSIRDHDPHPGAFEAALACLRSLGAPTPPDRPGGAGGAGGAGGGGGGAVDEPLTRFQWALLLEMGYRPELDRDVRTGAPLPEARRYLFAPHQGGVTATEPDDASPAWPVRAETITCLRALGDPASQPDAGTWDRAARLLAAYFREVLGQALPSLDRVFSPSSLPRPTRSS